MIKIRITGTQEEITSIIEFLRTNPSIEYQEKPDSKFYPSRDDRNEETNQFNFYADFMTFKDEELSKVIGGVLRDDQIIEYLKMYGASDTASLLRYFTDVSYEQLKEQLDRMVAEHYLDRELYGSNSRREGRYVYYLGPKVTKYEHTDYCLYQCHPANSKKLACRRFGRQEICRDYRLGEGECCFRLDPKDAN